MLEALLDEHRPAIALATGQAGSRSELAIERIAVNLVDARIPRCRWRATDRRARRRRPRRCVFSRRCRSRRCSNGLQWLGIPAALSQTAGAYVCNQTFFALAHLVATRFRDTRAGFVHVPWLPEQAARHAGQPSMALETMVDGVRAAIDCALATRTIGVLRVARRTNFKARDSASHPSSRRRPGFILILLRTVRCKKAKIKMGSRPSPGRR